MGILYILAILVVLALPSVCQAWTQTDNLESGSPFLSSTHYLNAMSQGANPVMTTDTNIKHGGTGSVRLNFYANCQNTLAQGQCGGNIARPFPSPAANVWRRIWIRTALNTDGTGVFQTYMHAFTKFFEDVATASPAGSNNARTWLVMGDANITNTGLQFHAERVPTAANTTAMGVAYSMPSGQWVCVETFQGMNTPGLSNGIVEVWINEISRLRRTDLKWRSGTSDAGSLWTEMELFRQGGRGYIWYDDYAASSDARVGCGGSLPPPDTTPPSIPVLTTNVSGTTITATWPAASDPESGINNYTLYGCSGASCTPNQATPIATLSGSTLTYVRSGLTNSTIYGHCLKAGNGTLTSVCSSPVQYETTENPAPVTPPTITSASFTATSITITDGPVAPTYVRVQHSDNAAPPNFNLNTEYPRASFVGGVTGTLTATVPDGTQWTCLYPRDAAHLEVAGDQKCTGQISGVPPIDETPITMGTPFPATSRPVNTTSIEYGVPINKVGACRSDTSDKTYDNMDVTTTAIQMSVSNLIASTILSGLTNGSSTQRWIQCSRTNTFDDTYNTVTAAVATLAVDASTADTTVPGTVGVVTATPVANTTNLNLSWPAATGSIGFYRVYLSTGACSTFTLSDNTFTTTSALLTLLKNTEYCIQVESVGTNGTPAAARSNTVMATTFSIPDANPPSIMAGLRVVDAPFTGSVQFVWDTPSDIEGSTIFTDLVFCAGISCSNFASIGARVESTSVIVALSPGTFYRAKGIHYDEAGNPSGGLANPTFGPIVQFTTATVGIGFDRQNVPGAGLRDSAIKPNTPVQRSLKP